jgi:hypothetical protein
VAAVAVLAAGLMVWTLWRSRGRAAGAWLLLWSYVFLNIAAVMVGRPQFGTQIGLLPRYAADVVPVAALALAFVVRSMRARPAHSSRFPRLGRMRPAVPWLVTVALVGSCALTTTAMAPSGYNRDDEEYVATLVRGLDSEPEAVLYDSLVPDNVMIGWFGDRRVTSTVLAGIDEHAVFDVPSENMRMVNGRGRLVDFFLSFPTRAPAGPVEGCGYPVARRSTIPLPKRLTVERAVVQISYFAARQNVMTLAAGDALQVVPVRRGAHVVDVVVSGTFDDVVLSQQDPAASACVTGLTVGFPAPRP